MTEIPNLTQCVAQRKIRNVVLTNAYFDCYGGSQMVTLDIGTALKRAGVDRVVIVSDRSNAQMEGIAKERGIELVSLFLRRWTDAIPERVDLLWGHHWPVLGALLLSAPLQVRYMVLGSLSAYEPIELNSFFAAAADVRTYNSMETAGQRSEASPVRTPEYVMLNSLPREWFDRSEAPTTLHRLGIVSNHIPTELAEAISILREGGMEVDLIGFAGEPRLMDIPAIDQYDAVVSIGHSVQKAMARRRPIFIYDRFGGPGWLTAAAVDQSESVNHSGRNMAPRRPAQLLADAIRSGFSNALAECDMLYDIAVARYQMEANLSYVLELLPPSRRWRSIDPSRPAFALERSAVQAYWYGKSATLPMAMKAMGNVPNLAQIRATLTLEPAPDTLRFFDLYHGNRPLEQLEVVVPAEIDSLPLAGNLVFADGARPDSLMFERNDGLGFPCTVNEPSPWISRLVNFAPGHDRAHFRGTLALTKDSRWFDLIAQHPLQGRIRIGRVSVTVFDG